MRVLPLQPKLLDAVFRRKKMNLFKMLQTLGTRFIASCNGDDTKPNNLIDDFLNLEDEKPNIWWFL